MKIDEVAQIMIGVLAKREEDLNGKNNYKLFSLKNYEDNKEYEILNTDKDLINKLAKNEDLLFRLLYPNKIIYVDKKLEGILIPSQFCIIRAKKEKIDPIVLQWYLESKIAKTELESKVTGSVIKSMTIANLKTLEIPDISEKQQKDMRQLIILWRREKEISKMIIEETDKLYQSYLEEMIQKGE